MWLEHITPVIKDWHTWDDAGGSELYIGAVMVFVIMSNFTIHTVLLLRNTVHAINTIRKYRVFVAEELLGPPNKEEDPDNLIYK